VVLVHGSLSDSAHAWNAVRPLLEDRATVFALDRRGHGQSGDAPGYEPRREYEDVAAVVESVPAPVDVIGHSFGALCTLEAARLTGRIRRMVLYEGIPRDGRTVSPTGLADRVELLVHSGDRERALDMALEEITHHRPHHHNHAHRSDSWSTALAGVATLPRELRTEHDFRFTAERYAGLACPTLVLAGAESSVTVREDASAVASGLPSADITLLEGQRHSCIHAAPELFADAVCGFLQLDGR
jgi:pimeloyl-ACP methyl ester carboxylesterase